MFLPFFFLILIDICTYMFIFDRKKPRLLIYTFNLIVELRYNDYNEIAFRIQGIVWNFKLTGTRKNPY